MRVDAFDFELPQERIALRPAVPRDSARLLAVEPQGQPPLSDRHVADLPALLRKGDCLVFNDTRVIPAQLGGRRLGGGGGARIGVTLHKRLSAMEWLAFARPARRLAAGDSIVFGETFSACVQAKGEAGEVHLAFDTQGAALEARLAEYGHMPLPPYIAARRAADKRDASDYQTLFAERAGAVAAPTAGLHFTEALMADLRAAGIGAEFLTLHVGAGTFLPVKAGDTGEHRMHAEWGEIGPDVAERLNAARGQGGRIVAVGTTALRLLESASAPGGGIGAFSGETEIFITPGHIFKAVDLLLTNFHLPRSTLFMLVAAFSGLGLMKGAYAHAIANGYRFYSYGDACLLSPAPESVPRKSAA